MRKLNAYTQTSFELPLQTYRLTASNITLTYFITRRNPRSKIRPNNPTKHRHSEQLAFQIIFRRQFIVTQRTIFGDNKNSKNAEEMSIDKMTQHSLGAAYFKVSNALAQRSMRDAAYQCLFFGCPKSCHWTRTARSSTDHTLNTRSGRMETNEI